MSHILNAIGTLIVGAALSLLAFVQGVRIFPPAPIWQQVVQAAPDLATVLGFGVCLTITIVGLTIAYRGIQACRHRNRRVTSATANTPWRQEPNDDDDEAQWR